MLHPIYHHAWREKPVYMQRGLAYVGSTRTIAYRSSEIPNHVFFEADDFITVLKAVQEDVVAVNPVDDVICVSYHGNVDLLEAMPVFEAWPLKTARNNKPLNLYAFQID